MFWLRRGLCGIELKRQTNIIAILHCSFASFLIIYGFIMIEKPERLIKSSFNDKYANYTNLNMTLQDQNIHQELVKHIQDQGLITSVSSLVSLILSVFLLYGSKRGQGMWMIPWVAQQVIELVVAFIYYCSNSIGHPESMNWFSWALLVVIYPIEIYLIYSVLSHIFLIKKMKKHSNDVINSVMGGGGYSSGFKFEVLSEELSTARELDMIQRSNTSSDNIEKRDDILYFSL